MTKKVKYIVVGAGISGLTIANELISQGVKKDELLVLEANDRVGGLIKTDRDDGYLCEWGPEGLRGKSEHTQRVYQYVDIDPIPVTEESAIRYIVKDHDLKKVPSGPLSAIFTPLIPFFGKLRLFKEPFIGKNEDDETIAEFVERRLGKGVLPLVDAFVSGVYGGNHEEISIRHAFPTLKELEVEYGSIIKGGIKSRKKKKKDKNEAKPESNGKPEKPPFLYSTATGMQGLCDALAGNVNVKLNTLVKQISKKDETYHVQTNSSEFITEHLIIATGVNGVLSINFDLEDVHADFNPVEESNVAVVSVGFEKDSFEEEIKGYGFLIPSTEEMFLLGTLFTSRLFPHHSPDEKVLLRCFIGGTRHPDRAEMPKETIVERVLSDLDTLLGLKKEPEFVEIQHHEDNGIPQLHLDHDRVINWKETVENTHSNLHFAGVGWYSIACDGLIEEGKELVDSILQTMSVETP